MKTFTTAVLFTIFGHNSYHLSAQTNSKSKTILPADSNRLQMPTLYTSARSDSNLTEINISQKFQEVEVRGNVTIILVNRYADKIWIKGNLIDLTYIETIVNKEKLVINAKRCKSSSGLTIYLPVTSIHSLVINDDAEIFSRGMITINDLQIILNGTSLVSLRYHGTLNIMPGTGSEIVDVEEYKKISSWN